MRSVDEQSVTNGSRLGRILSIVGTLWVGVSVLSAMGLFTALGLGGVLPAGVVSSIWPAFILIAIGRGITRQSRAGKPGTTSRAPQPGTTLTPPMLRDYQEPSPPSTPAPSAPKPVASPRLAAPPPVVAAPPPVVAAPPPVVAAPPPSTREPVLDDFPETIESLPPTSLSPEPLDMPDSLPRPKTSKELIEEAKRRLSED
jgi:hypothetical protein